MKKRLCFILAMSLLLASCSSALPKESSDSTHVSSSEETSLSSSADSTSREQSSLQSFVVGFYDGTTLLYLVEAEDGSLLDVPETPKKRDYVFAGWYADATFETEFDFTQAIHGNLSVFAKFDPINYFEGYNPNILPQHSPLSLVSVLAEGDEDPVIEIKADGVDFDTGLHTCHVRLFGSLSALSLAEAHVEGNRLTLRTLGTVGSGEAIVALAKEATTSASFVTGRFQTMPYRIGIDPASITIHFGDRRIVFSVLMNGQSLRNPDSLSAEEYLARVNDGTYRYFSNDLPDKYVFTVTAIHEDFQGFDAQIQCVGELNQASANELRDSAAIHIAKEALSGGQAFDVRLDITTPQVKTTVKIQPDTLGRYRGQFDLAFTGARVSNGFRDKKDVLLSDPYNVDRLIVTANAKVTLTSLSFPGDYEVQGEFAIESERGLDGIAQISLAPVTLEDGTVIHLTQSPFSDEAIDIPAYAVPYQIVYDAENAGTVSQTASSNYSGVKSIVNGTAFPEEDTGFAELIDSCTNVGKIGFGVASGSFDMAKTSFGNLIGQDSLRDPSTVILESLSAIMDELVKIEARLDGISEKLDLIEAELANIGQQSLLSNFLDAYSSWNAFVTDYYTPLVNAISLYTNSYFRYFYDFVLSTYRDGDGGERILTIYYDVDGNLAYPDDYIALSLNGKLIDRDATKQISIPELVHAIAGIRENAGHVYPTIEDDIIADLASTGTYDEDMLADIVKTIRFQAMKNYFSTQTKMDEFSNTFLNFCNALTGSSIAVGLQSTFTPLDSFATILETVFNFGFEADPDLNLIIIKLSTTYYCAENIIDFVDANNHGQILGHAYQEAHSRVKAELTSTRFYHSNDEQGNIYCYAAGAYVKHSLDAYGISIGWNPDLGDYGNFVPKMIRMADWNADGEAYSGEFRSIDEATAKLIGLKIKVYNKAKGTDYTMKEYLQKIGLISSSRAGLTYGLAIGLEGLIYGKSCADLSYYQEKMDRASINLDNGEVTISKNAEDYNVNMPEKWAIKGKVLSLDDGNTLYTGLGALYVDTKGTATSYGKVYIEMEGACYNGTIDYPNTVKDFPVYCYCYYLNLAPIN